MLTQAPTTGGTSNPSIDAILAAAQKYHIPAEIPLSIAGWETRGSYNAKSYNASDWNGYASVGLFQLNTAPGNPGHGYTVAQLEDPTVNADIAVARMQAAYNAAQQKGLTGIARLDYVANNSGWPDSAGVAVANRSEPAYDKGLNAFFSSGGASQSAGYSGSSGGSGQTGGDGITPFSFPAGKDPISVLNDSLKIQSFDVTKPVASITQDAGAIALRGVTVIIGIIFVAVAIGAAAKRAMGSQQA